MITLRPATEQDEPLLFRIHASTRAEELRQMRWSCAEEAAFLEQQFTSRCEDYRERFPKAAHQIVLWDGRPAGLLLVDRPEDEIRLVDIALLPEFRGRGIGTSLIGALLREASATHRPVRLHVEEQSRARLLYERLGFEERGADNGTVAMEWPAEGGWPGT